MTKRPAYILLLVAVLMTANVSYARKKNNKKEPEKILIDETPKAEEVDEPIKDYYSQLNGEWNIIEINKGEAVYLPKGSRAYLYLDVPVKRIYGSTGTNFLNANYTMNGNKINVNNMISTQKHESSRVDADIRKCLSEATTVALSKAGDVEYMELKNKHRDVVMKLRRQNLDFLNGSWRVKSINGVNVERIDFKLVNDVDMKTVNITSGANIINGVMTINPNKEFAVEYEDLLSSHYQWQYIDTETRLLIALEETTNCRKSGINEVELYRMERNDRGQMEPKTLVVLERDRF